MRGDDKWMLPSVTEKIDKIIKESTSSKTSSHKKHKKEKKSKSKKEKKTKKKNKRKARSTDSDDDSSDEEEIRKRKKKKRKLSTSSSGNSTTDPSADEWVEKPEKKPLIRDDWLAGMSLATYGKPKIEKKIDTQKKGLDAYDPGKSSRELNPYWKNGGTGTPNFQKPSTSDDEGDRRKKIISNYNVNSRGNWKKNKEQRVSETIVKKTNEKDVTSESSSSEDDHQIIKHNTEDNTSNSISTSDFLTDQQMNELGAKLIKAEIMGNDDLVAELKSKLDKARNYRETQKLQPKDIKTIDKHNSNEEHILLTKSSKSGLVRPLPANDMYGSKSSKKRREKVETHQDRERVRYFADDDKYNLKTMFECEKFITADDQDAEFAQIAGSHKNRNDDLDDLFSDKVRRTESDSKTDEKAKNKAIREHEQIERTLENCNHCFDSKRMQKQLIVAMGNHIYLSLPSHEGLQTGHCIIAPLQHISCGTQLDEEVWSEMNEFMKALTRMFNSRKLDVVFFETARYLHKKPHMTIHCVPSGNFELLPFYFKKSILESESDWAVNKQLVDLKGDRKDLRRAIPKGLPYFWVFFGVDSGFAHVIEDQEKFSSVFAQETIGGLLNLDPHLWRRPRKIDNMIPKVKQFAEWWKPFDVTRDN